ncbi:MAG: TlpA family protein disulfide reductase [Flavobacteriales bacterium]
MKKVFFIISFLCISILHAQVVINGRAPAYIGQEMSLVKAADYISGKGEKVSSAIVDDKGVFTLNVGIDKCGKYKLVCDNTEAIIYTDPDATYDIEFPEAEAKSKNEPLKFVALLFDTLLTYDINNLVLDFNSRADEFVYYNFDILGSELFSQRIDTFKLYLSKVYKPVSHAYFADYVAYSVAEIEMLGPPKKDQAIHELYMYSHYLNNRDIGYNHDKYMDFFNKFYESVLKETHPALEGKMVNAINYYASPVLLERVFQHDRLLTNKQIRELVMIKSLKEEYYSRDFLSEQILVMLDSISRFSSFEEHRTIAKNVIEQFTWLQVGSMAPEIYLNDQLDTAWCLSKLKGKHVYIGFWSVENTHSVNELQLLTKIYKKYKDDIAFMMINTDKNIKGWKDFLKKNPEYRWINLHTDGSGRVIRDYKVTSLPLYYLVGPDGKLLQSPALSPTPNGTFKSIDQVFHKISIGLHPRKRTNVGERAD